LSGGVQCLWCRRLLVRTPL